MGDLQSLQCALLRDDARVHAVVSTARPEVLCGDTAADVHVAAPFEPDDDLACVACAEAALRRPLAG